MVKESSPRDGQDEWLAIMGEIAARSQRLMQQFAHRADSPESGPAAADTLNLASIVIELTARMMITPTSMLQEQFSLWHNYLDLWQQTGRRLLNQIVEPLLEPSARERRGHDPAWNDDAIFYFIKQSYLLTTRWLIHAVNDVHDLDEKTRQKIDFYTRQFVDAIAPHVFVTTNPEVLRTTLESRGENLLRGLNNLLAHLDQDRPGLFIRTSGDDDGFEIGRNIATTPGKVVFQNDLMQLIQYEPTTLTVHERALLMVGSWMNKFYLLDLQPHNSFVRFALDQGFTVFVVSWVNPDLDHADHTFEDYMVKGPLAALGAIEQAIGVREVNAIGYCLGGTLLAATLAYMAASADHRVKTATFLTTLTDFGEPGELGMFIDEEQLAALDALMATKNPADRHEITATFNMLRANDLIWSFVINTYLLGKEHFPFDLLYWNTDSARLPAAMQGFYLRELYQKNRLARAGGIQLCGVPIDLGEIAIPVYMLAARDDHIAPWASSYAATRLFKGETTFVLTGSGHIGGVVAPTASDKNGYWLNDALPADPEDWIHGATRRPGSWWNHWSQWQQAHAGPRVKGRLPGQGELAPLEDAPGSYVAVRSM